jgi:hypothetical protein
MGVVWDNCPALNLNYWCVYSAAYVCTQCDARAVCIVLLFGVMTRRSANPVMRDALNPPPPPPHIQTTAR